MSLREITVASTTKSGAKKLQTEAVTWGQLKDSLRAEFGDLDKMRAVVRETRNDLASDDARLPEDDFTLLLSPRQIKAGSALDIIAILRDVKDKFADSIDEIIEDIEDGNYTKASESVRSKPAVVSASLSYDVAKDLENLKNGTL